MAEGLSAAEVGGEIGHHARHHGGGHHDRLISISEALLLSVVAIIAAWSGYSAAKWGTESSLSLAKASATRTRDAAGEKVAETADKYIRTTILASVLFLVGISTQFPLRGVRYGLIGVGAVLLFFAVVQILQLPGPPS